MKMRRFEITYHLMPNAENITMVILAKSYEDACTFAKEYRPETFSCKEVLEVK